MAKGRENRRGTHWLGLYTAIYLCAVAALGLVMLRHGKTLMWELDGVKQHYTVIGYVGQALRDLLEGRGYSMMKFTLGQGMDVMTTCSYYGYTDPLSLLGVFAQGDGIEWVYLLTNLLRLYLTGVFFGLYARKVGSRDGWATACAAAIYVFCGYFARMLGRHPYFINGGLYLPLLLLAVERVLEDRRWLMYVLVTALMLVVNFYFAYMNTVFAVVYIVVRLAFRLPGRGVRESAVDGLTLLGGYLLGAALSAVVFLPIVRVFIVNSRLGVQAGYSGSMLHYPTKWYREFAAYFFGPWDSPGNYLFANFAPLALFGLLAHFGVRGARAWQVRIALVLCGVAACVPMVGWLLNGTAYVSCRWSYALALFVALGCSQSLPALFKKRGACRSVIAIVALICAALLVVNCLRYRDHKEQLAAPLCIAGFSVFLLIYDAGRLAWLTRARARRLAALFLTATCALYLVIDYTPRGYGGIRNQMDTGVYRSVTSGAGGQLIDDDGVYRVAQGLYDDPNSVILGYMGTSYYWSLVDGENSQYYTELGMPMQTTTYHIYNLGGSAAMNGVAGVKYFLQHDGADFVVPYGYEPTGKPIALPDGTTADVYENTLALPLGYAYDARLTKGEYDALPLEGRLQSLLGCAIVDDTHGADLTAIPDAELTADAVELEYAAAPRQDVEWTAGGMSGPAGGSVSLTFEAPEDCEIYLLLEGLDLTSLEREEEGVLTVRSRAGRTTTNVPHPASNFYFPKRNLAFCLGSGALDGCEICLDNAASYRFERVRVVALPLGSYREAAEARRAEGLENVALGNDRLTGTIAVPGDRVLQIAVPFSDGWRAWVDGVEQPVFRCGGLYMGIAIGAGEHEIEMRYVTPGLKAGAAISIGAALLTVALAIVSRRRRKRAR